MWRKKINVHHRAVGQVRNFIEARYRRYGGTRAGIDENLFGREFGVVCFKEKWSREEWYRLIQVDGGETADETYDDFALIEHWVSDDYWVTLDKQVQLPSAPKTFQDHPLWHLMITGHDKAPCHDWQVFQTIKNEIVGPQYEAVEIYPARSRLMDRENKYHLRTRGPRITRMCPSDLRSGPNQAR
jgi:hypothetical protein